MRLFLSFVEVQSVTYTILSFCGLVASQTPVDIVFAQVQRVPEVAANIALLALKLRLQEGLPSFERWAAHRAFCLDVKKLIIVD